MVNSRSEYDEKRRDEAVRRLRYSHPIVVNRCRHAKVAWNDKSQNHKDTFLKSEDLIFTHGTRQSVTSCRSTRLNTRKSPLRGLFSAGNDEHKLTHAGDILICQNIEVFSSEIKLPYINAASEPCITPQSTPRDSLACYKGESEKKNTSFTTANSYIKVPAGIFYSL